MEKWGKVDGIFSQVVGALIPYFVVGYLLMERAARTGIVWFVIRRREVFVKPDYNYLNRNVVAWNIPSSPNKNETNIR